MTVEQDLQGQRIKPLFFIKIDGLEPILSQQHSLGMPTGWSRSIFPVLHLPTEHSTTLDLGDLAAAGSAMEFVIDDFVDTDGKWYFAKLFGPTKWDTVRHIYVAAGTAYHQQIDADATTINVKSTTAWDSSGTGYIGRETITWTGATATTLTGATKGKYPAVVGKSSSPEHWGQTYLRPQKTDKGYVNAIGQAPFTWIGRRVALYVTTRDEANERWNVEALLPYEIWEDTFADGDRGALWTDTEGNGTIEETGGALVVSTISDQCFWQAGYHTAPRAVLDLSTIATLDTALYCAEVTVTMTGVDPLNCGGFGLIEDESNAHLWAMRCSDGLVYERRGVADVWANGGNDGGSGKTDVMGRIYWVPAASTASFDVNGTTLSPGHVVMYSKRGTGAWTEIDTAGALGIDPDGIVVFCQNQPSNARVEVISVDYLTVSRTVDEASGAQLLWCGRIATDDSIQQVGKSGKWKLACKSILEDLKQPIAQDMPYDYLDGINLFGDKGRGFVAHSYGESSAGKNEWLACCSVQVAKGKYTVQSLAKAINSALETTEWTTKNAPGCDVAVWVDVDKNSGKVSINARPGGSTEFRRVVIDPDGLSKGEFSHALQALGFDGWADIVLDVDPDAGTSFFNQDGAPAGAYTESTGSYLAYHPVHRLCNGNKMLVESVDPFWADQGDMSTAAYAHVKIEEANLVSGETGKRDGTLYSRYTAKDTTNERLTIDHVHNRKYALDGYVGQLENDDKVKVEQCYIPHWGNGNGSHRGPFEQLLYPLLSTGTDGYNEDAFTGYDSLRFQLSVGMQERLVDVQSFLDADNAVKSKTIADRTLHPWEPGDTWLERAQMECRLFGYAIVWMRGKVTLVDILSPKSDIVDITINESVRAGWDDFPDMGIGVGTVVNRYTVELTSPETDIKQTIVITDADSSVAHKVIKNVDIKSSGLPIETGKVFVQDLLEAELYRRPLRYASPVVIPELAHSLMYRVWAGGTVRFIASNLSDLEGSGDRGINVLATVIGVSWDYDAGRGDCTLALHGQYSRWGQPYAPAALVDISATNGGWDAVTYQLTVIDVQFGQSGDPDDGAAVAPTGGEKCRIIERAPSDPTSPQSWDVVVADSTPYETDGAQLITLASGTTLTGWDSDVEYIITWDDWDQIVTAQETLGTWFADETTELLDSGGDNDPAQRYG